MTAPARDAPYPRLPPAEEPRVLALATLAAFVIEALVLTALGWHGHWLAHPQPAEQDTSHFIEAQMFEVPPEAHLVDEKKIPAPRVRETAISKVVGKGRKPKPGEEKPQDENQTESGPKVAPNHGPVAMYAPSPTIPDYLRNENIHASAVIDFYVNAQGVTTPKLVGSSGNEELDAIAVRTAARWQFRPGMRDGKPVDSKVRLRIVFEVQ